MTLSCSLCSQIHVCRITDSLFLAQTILECSRGCFCFQVTIMLLHLHLYWNTLFCLLSQFILSLNFLYLTITGRAQKQYYSLCVLFFFFGLRCSFWHLFSKHFCDHWENLIVSCHTITLFLPSVSFPILLNSNIASSLWGV